MSNAAFALPIGGVALVLLQVLRFLAVVVKFEKLAGPRFDLAQGLNQEGKAVRKGKKRSSLTARAGHLQLPLPVNQER
jgi:hypothetical protein